MTNREHRGAWLVYLNGIEVPCPEVSVTYGVWQVPEATLNFPPHRYLQRLGAEDRLEVAIFFLDDLLDPMNPTFRLLFEGEILGWSYTNSPFGRMMQFNAIADISILQSLNFHFINNVDVATAFHTEPSGAKVLGASNLFYPASLFYKGLFQRDERGVPVPNISRPYELLENAVRGMMNAKPGSATLPGINFYTRWAKKKGFHNRIAAMPLIEDPSDKTLGIFPIYKSAKMSTAVDAMREGLAPSVGEAGTVFDVLKEIFTKAYSELAMLPTAPALKVRLSDGVIEGTYGPSEAIDDQHPLRIINHFTKPQMLFAIPPMCNVLFPSEIRSLTYQENYWAQPTRVYVNDGFIGKSLEQNYFTAAALKVGYPPAVNATVQQAWGEKMDAQALLAKDAKSVAGAAELAKAGRALHNTKNLLLFPEEFYKGPVISQMPLPSWFSLLIKLSNPEKGADGKERIRGIDDLFSLYAKYEFFKQRYEKRSGSVDLVWDPYVVPGFPCVVFDQRTQGMDAVGYLTQVTHQLSAKGKGSGSMRTSVSYSHGRTLWEMLDLTQQAFAATKGSAKPVLIGNAPADPIQSISDITQQYGPAETMYRSLFFGPGDVMKKKASFDYHDMLGYVDQESPLGDAVTVTKFDRTSPTAVPADKRIEALQPFDKIFADYDSAMALKSRPICTLEQYIRFRNGGKTVADLESDNKAWVKLRDDRYVYDPDHPSARFWVRIFALRQGPGTPPPNATMGVDPVTETVSPKDPEAVDANFPQTRQPWDLLIMKYRAEMYDNPFHG